MAEIFRITIEAKVGALRIIRQMLSKKLNLALKQTSLKNKIDDILLATDEAAQNIIRHAFGDALEGKMTIIGELTGGILHIYLQDTAPLVELEKIAPRDLEDLREGGLGTYFVQTLADEAVWSHFEGRNRLDLRWRARG